MTDDNTVTLGYDARGNLRTVTDDDSDLALTYDGLDRVLTQETLVTAGGTQPAVLLSNTYNAVGDRVRLEDSLGGTQTYEYDGAGRMTRLAPPAGAPGSHLTCPDCYSTIHS